jgi:hypothetical protein
METINDYKAPLLTTNNHKTIKGEKLGYMTYVLYMSPFTANSKGINVCSHASKGCSDACLVSSGFGGMFKNVMEGRVRKTEFFLKDRVGFLNKLANEISQIKQAKEGKAIVTIRLNGTSDLPYEKYKVFDNNTKNIFELFPDIQFYDYTKNHLRFDKVLPSNYHLTFSRSETNEVKALELLKRGFNVSMVFEKLLPETYKGYEVVNGDETDLRFLDKKNVIVGLKYKFSTGVGGKEKNTEAMKSGFVILTSELSV